MLPGHIPIVNKGAFHGTITFLLLANIANSFIRIPPAPIFFLIFAPLLADVLKLVDNPDLGSGALRRGGSSPPIRTKDSRWLSFALYFVSLTGGLIPQTP